LRELGITDPTTTEDTVEKITGEPSTTRQWSYKERRKELLLALLDDHGDTFDTAIDDLGRVIDHLRHVGIRGFLAENTNDDDFTTAPGDDGEADEPAAADTDVEATRRTARPARKRT